MTWVAVAIGGASLLGNLAGGAIQAGGQKQAAQTQQNMFNTIVGQEQPFLNAGYGATTSLSNLLGTGSAKAGSIDPATGLPVGYLTQTFQPTQAQLDAYPGFQFNLQTGGQALENANTPGVGALSGPALKSLMSFNQGTAQSYYGNYFNQFQQQQNNIFNRLSGIASLGQNAAGNLGNAGTQLGTGIAQAQAGAAGSIAGGVVGAGNSVGNGVALNYLLNNSNPNSTAFGSAGAQNATYYTAGGQPYTGTVASGGY